MSTALASTARDGGLGRRILETFPAGTYGLSALLRVVDIVATEEIPTAAIECRPQPRLLLNPRFVEKHAETSEKLLMLVMHELHHLLLGHTRLHRRLTLLDNLVFDAVINATLVRLLPEPEHVAFLTDLYDDARFPECFLRPAPGWRPEDESPPPPRALLPSGGLAAGVSEALCELHAALYSPRGATYEELRAVLSSTLGELPEDESPVLLGDHGPEGSDASSGGHLRERSPVLLDGLRRVVEHWPCPSSPEGERAVREALMEERIEPPPVSNEALLRWILLRVARDRGSDRARRPAVGECPVSTPVPRPSRRAMVLRALGRPPLLHEGAMSCPAVERVGQRVHVYFDVSGSMGALVGPVASAIAGCRDFVHPVVHQFSTEVADLSLAEVRQGLVRTDGGTDIACVAQHALRHGVRRAVLITDGMVGSPGKVDRKILSAMKLGVALTPDSIWRHDLEGLADHWVQLHLGGASR